MATSYPNRNSPVLRGKWLLDNILGMPPPPPPPNVPPLKESGADGKATVGSRADGRTPQKSCLRGLSFAMDPLGFALETLIRSGTGGRPAMVCRSTRQALCLMKPKFEGADGLGKVLSGRDGAAETFTTKMLITPWAARLSITTSDSSEDRKRCCHE